MKYILRDNWLQNAVLLLRPIFNENGLSVPEVLISCGFASTGMRSNHIGQCWNKSSCDQNINQIFISPLLDDPVEILDTLVHELVHAVDDCQHGHGREFKKIALAVGLEGKMRNASAGKKLRERLVRITKKLGSYPHTKLQPKLKIRIYKSRPKAVCSECGYEVTPVKKWCHLGPPICPIDKIEMQPIGEWENDI